MENMHTTEEKIVVGNNIGHTLSTRKRKNYICT